MNKKLISVSLLLLVFSIAKGQGISFERNLSWAQILEKAGKENKYIFLDAVASWCAPCKEMSVSVFPDSTLGTFVNQHFISVQLQMDTSAKDSEEIKMRYADAKLLSQQLAINAYPSLFFFSPNGKLVHKFRGFRNVDEMLGTAKAALDTNKQYYSRINAFRAGNHNLSFVKQLLVKVKAEGDEEISKEIIQKYIEQLSRDSLYKKHNLIFIADYAGLKSDAFKVSFKDRKRVDSVLGTVEADRLLRRAIYNYYFRSIIEQGIYKKTVPDFLSVKKEMNSLYGKTGEREYLRLRALYHFIQYQDSNGGEAAIRNFHKYKSELRNRFPDEYLSAGVMELNNDAWFLFEHATDKEILKTALTWSQQVLKREPNVNNWMDTYANLLYKLGRVSEAIEQEEKALNLDPENVDIKNNLSNMKKGQPTWPITGLK